MNYRDVYSLIKRAGQEQSAEGINWGGILKSVLKYFFDSTKEKAVRTGKNVQESATNLMSGFQKDYQNSKRTIQRGNNIAKGTFNNILNDIRKRKGSISDILSYTNPVSAFLRYQTSRPETKEGYKAAIESVKELPAKAKSDIRKLQQSKGFNGGMAAAKTMIDPFGLNQKLFNAISGLLTNK